MANNRKKGSPAGAIFALLMLIVIIIALVIVLRSCQAPGGADESPSAPAGTVSGDVPGGEGQTQQPGAETGAPASATPPATPSTTPTATPSPTPPATPAPNASGSFRSDSGTPLNIVCSWTLNGSTLNVTVDAESYSLYSQGAWHALSVVVGGQTYYFDTANIQYDGPGLGTHRLGTATVSGVSAGSRVEVSWHFGGRYGDVDLETITASGTVG